MYTGLLHTHSGLRYLVIAGIIIVIIQSLYKWIKELKFEKQDRRISTITVALMHIQWITGLALYFISSKVMFDADTMKSSLLRFFTMEHPLMMMIAVIVITIGHAKTKTYTNYLTHKKLFIYYVVVLVIIIAAIPWPFREQLGGSWF